MWKPQKVVVIRKMFLMSTLVGEVMKCLRGRVRITSIPLQVKLRVRRDSKCCPCKVLGGLEYSRELRLRWS